MTARIYDRPDLDQARHVPALYVDGSLPNAKPSVAYEGRLQIHNAIGACTVEQIDGDTLPNGASLYVDNDTSEVVIAWPAYSSTTAPIFNGGFEAGDTGWIKGAGWAIESTGGSNPGFGSHVGVYRGQGESFMEAATYYPAQAQTFGAQVNVQQGASSSGNTGAGIGVRYYDAAKNLLATQIGNMVTSGKSGAWHYSTGTFTVPAETAYVRPVIKGFRNRQNLPLWVDDASWGYQTITGINIETTLALTLRVNDSAGRSALWSGSIIITPWDNGWSVYTTIYGGHKVAYSAPLGVMVTGNFASAAVAYSEDQGETWASGTGVSGSYTEEIIWSDRLSLFIAGGINGNKKWSSDGKTWYSGTGDYMYGWRLVETPSYVYAFGGQGSAQVSRSANGKSWAYSGTTIPESMGVIQAAAYSDTLARVVAVSNNGKVMYNATNLYWVSNSGVINSSGLSDVIWSGVHQAFFAISSSSPAMIYKSNTGQGQWTHVATLSAAMGACAGIAFSPELGFCVANYNANRFCRLDNDLNVVYESGYTLGVTPSFGIDWVDPLGKFIFMSYGNIAVSST